MDCITIRCIHSNLPETFNKIVFWPPQHSSAHGHGQGESAIEYILYIFCLVSGTRVHTPVNYMFFLSSDNNILINNNNEPADMFIHFLNVTSAARGKPKIIK